MDIIDKILTWQIEKLRIFVVPILITEVLVLSFGFAFLMLKFPIWLRVTIMIILPILLIRWIKGLKYRRLSINSSSKKDCFNCKYNDFDCPIQQDSRDACREWKSKSSPS